MGGDRNLLSPFIVLDYWCPVGGVMVLPPKGGGGLLINKVYSIRPLLVSYSHAHHFFLFYCLTGKKAVLCKKQVGGLIYYRQ